VAHRVSPSGATLIHGQTLRASNGVVSIRVEALGVLIKSATGVTYQRPDKPAFTGPPQEDAVLTGSPGNSGTGFAHAGTAALVAGRGRNLW
jgi:hypothetical protein